MDARGTERARPARERIVDAHTHLGLEAFIVKPIPEEKRKLPGFRDRMENRVDALIARMDANGVCCAVAFPFPLEEVDPVAANTYVLDAYRAHPDRIIPFSLMGDDTDHWLRRGAKGFKQHILQSPQRFDRARAYREMARAGVPLVAHLSRTTGKSIPEQVKEIRRHASELKVIVAHMGRSVPNTGEGVEENLRGLRDMENVFLETSTVRDPELIAQAVNVLGGDRLIFGSDFPFNSFMDPDPLAIELETLRRADLTPEILRRVLGENLLCCLNLL